jgi:hypothetical protein
MFKRYSPEELHIMALREGACLADKSFMLLQSNCHRIFVGDYLERYAILIWPHLAQERIQ